VYDLAPPVLLGQRLRTEGSSAWLRWQAVGLQADAVCCVYLEAWSLAWDIISSRISQSFHAVLLFSALFYTSLAFFCGLIPPTILTCSILLAFLSNSTAVLLDQLGPVATLFPCLAILDVDRLHFLSTAALRLWVFLPPT
jgi:hypothetical protein